MLKKIYKHLLNILFLLIYGKITVQKTDKQHNIKVSKITKLKSKKTKNKNYFVYEIKNGRVYTDNNENVAVINDNQIVKDVSFQQKNSYLKSIKYNSSLKQGTPALQKKFKGKVLILCQGASGINNYSHWLLDILPKIKICEEVYDLKDIDYFYIQNKTSFQKESFKKIGIPTNKIIDCGKYKHIKADKIIALTHHVYEKNDYILNAQKKQPEWSIVWLRKKFLQFNKKNNNNYKVFIDRSDSKSKHCKIINNDTVIGFFKKLNFKIYQLSNLSFNQQIKIFNNSRVIVGVHGAGLTNFIFCKKNTKILEIRNKPNPNEVYEKIGFFNKLKYRTFKVDEIKNNKFGDMIIDIKKLENQIKYLL